MHSQDDCSHTMGLGLTLLTAGCSLLRLESEAETCWLVPTSSLLASLPWREEEVVELVLGTTEDLVWLLSCMLSPGGGAGLSSSVISPENTVCLVQCNGSNTLGPLKP